MNPYAEPDYSFMKPLGDLVAIAVREHLNVADQNIHWQQRRADQTWRVVAAAIDAVSVDGNGVATFGFCVRQESKGGPYMSDRIWLEISKPDATSWQVIVHGVEALTVTLQREFKSETVTEAVGPLVDRALSAAHAMHDPDIA